MQTYLGPCRVTTGHHSRVITDGAPSLETANSKWSLSGSKSTAGCLSGLPSVVPQQGRPGRSHMGTRGNETFFLFYRQQKRPVQKKRLRGGAT